MATPIDTPLTRLLWDGPFVHKFVDVDNFVHYWVDRDEAWMLLSAHDDAVRADERAKFDK